MPTQNRLRQLLRPAGLVGALALSFVVGLLTPLGLSGRLASPLGIGPFSFGAPSTAAALLCQDAAQLANPVAAENTCPGSSGWQIDHPTGSDDAIEAFAAPVSVNAGERVRIYVSTTAATYTFQVYRLGWYQGLGGRLVYSSAAKKGIRQPLPTIDPTTRMVSCSNWRDPVTLRVPATWVSGVYVVKLLSSAGYVRYTSFVVRQDQSHSQILFQASVLTYQAYNLWGGYSLYFGTNSAAHGSANDEYTRDARSYIVSFDRPYADNAGLGDFVRWEFNLLRWVERQGYEVSYTTDVDTDQRGSLLIQHHLLLVAGHDEYWSTAMRTAVTVARDVGVSLAFFGANDSYWHARMQNSPLGPGRELICYREPQLDPAAATAPNAATVTWRGSPLNDPENELIGQMYEGSVQGTAPYVLAAGAQPFLRGTDLTQGSVVPGVVGGEFDHFVANALTPPSVSIVASASISCSSCGNNGVAEATATLYTALSGARVFDAGTFQWSWGLDDAGFDPHAAAHSYSNPHFQRFTANLLAYLLG